MDNDKLEEFIKSSNAEEHDFESKTSIHPLFAFLSENYDPVKRFK